MHKHIGEQLVWMDEKETGEKNRTEEQVENKFDAIFTEKHHNMAAVI